MPQLDLDPFTYSNGNLATVSAAKWTKLSSFNDPVVASNKVVGSAGADHAAVISAWAGSAVEQYSQIVLTGTPNFTGPTVYSDGAGTFYFYDVRNAGSFLYKVVAGAFTQIGPAGAAGPVSGDTFYIENKNGNIICKRNGAADITHTDTSIASGKPGIRIFDNINQIDDWAAGDFSVAGGVTLPMLEKYRGLNRGVNRGVH